MLSTFVTAHGSLIVRSEDIRRIIDTLSGCELVIAEGEATRHYDITGTAAENLARLKAEEQAAILEAEQLRARVAGALPVPPVARGRR